MRSSDSVSTIKKKVFRKCSLTSSIADMSVISQRLMQEPGSSLETCDVFQVLLRETSLQTSLPLLFWRSSFIKMKALFHLATTLNTSSIFIESSEQCPWQLLLELRKSLLLL